MARPIHSARPVGDCAWPVCDWAGVDVWYGITATHRSIGAAGPILAPCACPRSRAMNRRAQLGNHIFRKWWAIQLPAY